MTKMTTLVIAVFTFAIGESLGGQRRAEEKPMPMMPAPRGNCPYECPAGYTCQNGECWSTPGNPDCPYECPAGYTCQNGECWSTPGNPGCPYECPAGYTCQNGECWSTPGNLGQCVSDEQCLEGIQACRNGNCVEQYGGQLAGGRRRAEEKPMPAPQGKNCQSSYDCNGQGVYCYPGNPENYCSQGDGIGSLCFDNAGCGYIGDRQLVCAGGYCSEEAQPNCETAWDCSGDGEFCYQGTPNFCAYNGAEGSLCEDASGCGDGFSCDNGICTSGGSSNPSWYCSSDMDCTAGYTCQNGECQNTGNPGQCMSDDQCFEGQVCANGNCVNGALILAGKEKNAKNAATEEGSEQDAGLGSGLGADQAENVEDGGSATKDDNEERRRGDVTAMTPRTRPAPRRPRPRHECYNAWDCPGVGEYCYQGWNGNYCQYDSGIGSICQRDSDCGWLGYQQMYCDWGQCQVGWRRLDDETTADAPRQQGVGSPRPGNPRSPRPVPAPVPVPRPHAPHPRPHACPTSLPSGPCSTLGQHCDYPNEKCLGGKAVATCQSNKRWGVVCMGGRRRADACPTSLPSGPCSTVGQHCDYPNEKCPGGKAVATCQSSKRWGVVC